MLLTIERVALLRRVDLFSQTPDRVLAGVAQVLCSTGTRTSPVGCGTP
jgi:hypothetical protein